MESLVWERKAKLNCSPKFGKVAKIEKRPENEQQKSWNKRRRQHNAELKARLVRRPTGRYTLAEPVGRGVVRLGSRWATRLSPLPCGSGPSKGRSCPDTKLGKAVLSCGK